MGEDEPCPWPFDGPVWAPAPREAPEAAATAGRHTMGAMHAAGTDGFSVPGALPRRGRSPSLREPPATW
eukprot:11191748-Lingulodinium_polyedra.AAC.1